jgi:3-oxoacyl-[acyl-carrier protein] reductase
MDLGLLGARVLVTAASQGLGAALAKQFSREGAQVVISSRDLDKLQNTASEIVDSTGNAVYTHMADVTDENSVKKLIQHTVETLGGLDVLILNAGGPPPGTFETLDSDAWLTGIHLSLLSGVNLVREALPHLKQSKRPAVLAIVSTSVKQPVDNITLSNAIRPGMVGLMKTLSQEMGQYGIRFNSILPGTIETERIDSLVQSRASKNNTSEQQERDKLASVVPLGRVGQPQEFANVAVFLCSPAASFVNGIAMPVDGGALKGTW